MSESPTTSNALPASDQRRNGWVFFIANALTYLVAPVSYVGILHASLLDSLEAGDTLANLPEAVFLWMTPLPVAIAWIWPSPRLLRPILMTALIAKGLIGALAACVFLLAPRSWWIPMLLLHPAVIGITSGVQAMCLWELVGRGLSLENRGRVLGWTFGIGPLFAVLGSCGSQLILNGNFLDLIVVTPMKAPWSYLVLFGISCPAAWLSACLIWIARVPPLNEVEPHLSWREVSDSLRDYVAHPLIVITALGFLLTYGGTMILNNLSLYARETLDAAPESYAGTQLALRFGFKSLFGFALGAIAARVHAKGCLLTTTSLCIAGILWALFIPGRWYLISFGLLGAGELFFVYYMNYLVGCSQPHRIRANTAYTNLLTVSIGFLPVLFGMISDQFGIRYSFFMAIGILALALSLVLWLLPSQPRPRGESQR